MSSKRSGPLRILRAVVALLVLGGAGGAVTFWWVFVRDLPDPASIADYQPARASTVYDREGRPVGEFFKERRRLVGFDQVPRHVVAAFVSAEDASFFEHQGIDFQGIVRAAWKNFLAGDTVQGASTITQQTVKSLLLTPERTYTRKIREMILARRIEQRFTKQEILYLYLNQIYFGHGAHGIGEAARTYFEKPVSELTLSEGAQLAGLPKAPSRYSPMRNPDAAEQRRRYVLGRMLEDRAVDRATYEAALAARPEFSDGSRVDAFETAAYFSEEVRRYLFEVLGGDAVLEGGLRIETTLDLDLQHAAVTAVRSGLEALDRRNGYRGPLRRVESPGLADEIERLGQENYSPELEMAAEEGADAAVIGALADVPPLLGVVTALDREGQRAEVALGLGLAGTVSLGEVSWARPLDPGSQPHKVKAIEKVFAVGDVARFRVLPPAEGEGGAADGLRLSLYQQPQVQGALISIEVETGDVVAMVGGYDFDDSQFNRATQARRQPGSAFKPLVYGAALSLTDAEGRPRYTPASIVHDRPKVYTDHRTGFVWKPENYDGKFKGPITLRTALSRSINNASLYLCEQVGVGAVMDYARRLGIRSPLERSLAIALGTSDVSLLELTRAYAVFPSGGRRVVPVFVRRVLDEDGQVLLENVPLTDAPEGSPDSAPAEATVAAGPADDGEGEGDGAEPESEGETPAPEAAAPADGDRVLTPEQAYLMSDMLRAVVNEGTGRRARALGRPLAGKTGTTNDQADAWFVGFSPELATGVWVGFDETRKLGAGETGSRAALPVWIDYMGAALGERPRRDFAVPSHSRIVWARIDRDTGLLASRHSENTVFQPFVAGSEPTRSADAAREVDRARDDLRADSFEDPAFEMYHGF